jgi:hypothetical protein
MNNINKHEALSFEDLRVRFGTGRSYIISGTGKDRVWGYRIGMQCKLGDIEISEWTAMVRGLIEQKGEQELYQQLLTFLKERNYAKAPKSKLEQEALKLHAARIFDDPLWVNFIPFNERFRPEVLRTVKLVSVMSECCKKEGKITEARYLSGGSSCNENYCPHCGRWTQITLVNKQEEK